MKRVLIEVEDRYLDRILDFLKNIPIKITLIEDKENNKKDNFLSILKEAPTLSEDEIKSWESSIKKGFKSWNINENSSKLNAKCS